MSSLIREIASRLGGDTIGRWRREEDWDELRRKVKHRAAEMFAEKIASDRVTLNVRHYRMWDLLVAIMAVVRVPRKVVAELGVRDENRFRLRWNRKVAQDPRIEKMVWPDRANTS